MSWISEGLSEEPYGLLPLSNLSSKGSSSVRFYEQVGSYNWLLPTKDNPDERCIVVPGAPYELIDTWVGGKVEPDDEPLLYDSNHLHWPQGPMDAIFQSVKLHGEQDKKPVNFQDFDVVTDAMNLQKMYAFCKGGDEDGMFRLDVERVGKMVIVTRVEPGDWMKADFLNFDINMRKTCTKPHTELATGPFQQIAKYQFGQLKMLVRYESHGGDYNKITQPRKKKDPETGEVQEPSRESKAKFDNSDLYYISSGYAKKSHSIITTNYPAGKGFPYYTWAQLFFTGADNLLVGWYKNVGDFQKPALYALADINKLMKPLPYVTLAKVNDILTKLVSFMLKCEDGAKVSLIWNNQPHLEIYERKPDSPSGISEPVRAYLHAQVNEADMGETSGN